MRTLILYSMNGSSYRKGEPHFTVDLVPKRWVQMTFLYNSCIFPQTNMTISNMFRRRRQWHPTTVLLPGKSYGWRSLVGCSSWGRKESDTTKGLHFDFSLSCTGEENGNPLQCSCLENPRDGGAWWAAVYGVTQSQTRLKRFSSSSSSNNRFIS